MIDERELFERAAMRFDPPVDAFGRLADRRVWRNRARRASIIAVALVLAGAAAIGVVTQFRNAERRTPATPSLVPPAPEGFRSSLLPLASLAYPDGWSLLDTSAKDQTNQGPVLQLTSFDAGLRPLDCSTGGFPADGVALVVAEAGPATADAAAWPVGLSPTSAQDGSGCPGRLEALWRTGLGVEYRAEAYLGDAVSVTDRRALSTAFGSLMTPSAGWPRLAPSGDGPRVILDSGLNGADPVSLYAYVDRRGLWLGVMGPVDSANADTPTIYQAVSGIDTGPAPPGTVEVGAVDVTVDGAGTPYAVVYGTAGPGVERADVVPASGARYPATIVAFPPSLGRADRAVWAFLPGPTGARIDGLGYDTRGNLLGAVPDFSTGPPDEIASGQDADLGRWTLSITHSREGDGLDLSWPDLGSSGGPCCFDLFDRPASDRIVLLESGGPDPSTILALVSPDAARLEFATGSLKIPGELVALPDRYMGPAYVAVVVVPDDLGDGYGDLLGTLIAYDAEGNRLATAFIGGGVAPENLSPPSSEAAAVWESLARARNAMLGFLGDHALTEATMARLAQLDPHVRWAGPNGSPGSVSLAVDPSADGSGGDVLLTSRTASGRPYCIAVHIGGDGRMAFHYGAVDAATAAECAGGWR